MSFFEKQTSFDVEYAPAHITKWRSQRTGLQVTYIEQESPIINGYFAVATEIENNSGCPHTLEHLIFMGSRKFPYKGLLDSLGNRYFSSTNAWTAVDQTVYTLTTAGWEGFKTLLPIYLDHLFNPTLTDEACLTEVYHIDGEGKEKGVVFSEMQGIESLSWFITYLAMQQLLYSPDSGYSSETGGLMSELRHLKNDQIRDFHNSLYRPSNLCLVITGTVDEKELMKILTTFDSELPQLPETLHKRPFVDSKPDLPLKNTIVKEIEFPDNDESFGEVAISWIGPKTDNVLANAALDSLGSYFTDSAISLFNKILVETEDPLATETDFFTDDYLRTAFNFTISGVPTGRLYDVDSKVKEMIRSQATPLNIDLKYMRQVIKQQRLKFISSTERSASSFATISIGEFIYGKADGSDLKKWTENIAEFDILLQWTPEQWSSFIKEMLIDNKSATVLGRPSAKLNEKLELENKKVLQRIESTYGPQGLKELETKVKKAQEKNDEPIPDELLTQFGKPDPSKINFIQTKSYRGGLNHIKGNYIDEGVIPNELQRDSKSDIPLFLHFEDFKSQFTTINLVLSSKQVEPRLLKYMSVIEEIFTLPLRLPNDEYIPFEEVISQVKEDVIDYLLDNGFESQFLELVSIRMKFESKNYAKAIQWLLNFKEYSVFEESRIKIIIEKIVNSLPEKKRNEELMMYSCHHRNLFNDSSIMKAQDCMNTEQFYKELLEKIDTNKYHEIEKDLLQLRNQLFNSDSIKIFIIGNLKGINGPVSSWSQFAQTISYESYKNVEVFDDIPHSHQYRSDLGNNCSSKAFVVTTPAAESSHLVTSTLIPTDYLHDDIFKIALASELLSAVEGPFWRGIRGTGLAYGSSIRRNLETGYLSFTIYRSSDLESAWLTGKRIVEEYCNGTASIDPISLENTISVIVNELANAEANNYDAAINKITDNLFKNRGPDYIPFFLKRLNKITAEEVVGVMRKYFKPLFEANSSIIFSCVPPAKADHFALFLKKMGYDTETEDINADIIEDSSDLESDASEIEDA
ncbi:uncharacterized protein PRCAT00002658001 [Priceomyces carsonii]|uniref:uncharacterized protein n=1 Tax=Priceomyces carsonii TaxID=28549 RepID=UPI002EDA3C37|nr:unnamed protein product [Priceomyces carsonii]